MTSATEVLRRMLDERGVEWEDASPVPSMHPWKTSYISFTGEEVTISCYDEPKWLMGTMVFFTPEQAIAATLGRGTCKLTMDGTDGCFGCSECFENIPPLANYCPNCGRRVEQ